MSGTPLLNYIQETTLELDPSAKAALTVGAATMAGYTIYKNVSGPDLSHIPAIGDSGWLSPYAGARMFQERAREMVQEGVDKYPGRAFRVPLMDSWIVVISGRGLVDELRAAREDELSFRQAAERIFQMQYTFGLNLDHHDSQLRVVQGDVTRNIGHCFGEIYDEIETACNDVVAFQNGEEWCTVNAHDAVMTLVNRVGNRYFVGLPLCRHEGFLKANMEFAHGVMQAAGILHKFPSFVRPLIGKYLSPYRAIRHDLLQHIGAVVAQRIRDDDELCMDRPDRPNDLISWVLSYLPPELRNVDEMVLRIMHINFGALHTSTSIFTYALLHLAAEPHVYLGPLREEAEEVISRHGWGKTAMREMHKVDSFLREAGRFNGLGCLSLDRVVTKKGGYTFSDGTYVPEGVRISVASHATHRDEDNYPNAHVFDGFRYSRLRENDPKKYQMVKTDCDYLLFGHGFHACPGRFFAANELKAMLAHIVLHYDVQLEGGSRVKPENEWFRDLQSPSHSARVMFRKRSLG
ncbi:cytochrome P450 [Schizophyllum commune Loenen D]|nr:cytochrome P450 [Schizophyllum commune Loenen D]